MPGVFVDVDDVGIFVTEACNSNCVMCPLSTAMRKRGNKMLEKQWMELLESIPYNPPHITITGGEPFLEYRYLFPIMEKINQRYPETEILVLTNGRAFAVKHIVDSFAEIATTYYTVAIPIHGPSAAVHDRITQTEGSFRQSMIGLKRLGDSNAKIEVRIVAHRLNISEITHTFQMLVDSGVRISTINLVGLEMTGTAASNRNMIWVDYQQVCDEARAGILYAIRSGIDVSLYNFPLCFIPRDLWALAKCSITPNKVRYDQLCGNCIEKKSCGGMFYSTYQLGLCQVNPFL